VGGILRRHTSSLVDMLSPNSAATFARRYRLPQLPGFTMTNGMMESDLREAQIEAFDGHGRATHHRVGRSFEIWRAFHSQLTPARRDRCRSSATRRWTEEYREKLDGGTALNLNWSRRLELFFLSH
jgi:hypothetical protein